VKKSHRKIIRRNPARIVAVIKQTTAPKHA
jgi:hypothetical protein